MICIVFQSDVFCDVFQGELGPKGNPGPRGLTGGEGREGSKGEAGRQGPSGSAAFGFYLTRHSQTMQVCYHIIHFSHFSLDRILPCIHYFGNFWKNSNEREKRN